MITGIAGQDGFYLTKLLLSKRYEVYGIDVRSMEKFPVINSQLASMSVMDLNVQPALVEVLKRVRPDGKTDKWVN